MVKIVGKMLKNGDFFGKMVKMVKMVKTSWSQMT
jgi:hypothetical protein